jgi:hypothetical protein
MPERSPVQVAEPRRGPQKRLMTHQDRAVEPPRKLSKKLPKKEEAVLFEDRPSLETPPPQEDSTEFSFPTTIMESCWEVNQDNTNSCNNTNSYVTQDMWCSTNNNLVEYVFMANNGVPSPVESSYPSLEQQQESLQPEKDETDKMLQANGYALEPFVEDLFGLGHATTEAFVHDNTDICEGILPVTQEDVWCLTNNNSDVFTPASDVEDYGGCVAPAEAEGNLMAFLTTSGEEQKQEMVYECMVNNNGVLSCPSLKQEPKSFDIGAILTSVMTGAEDEVEPEDPNDPTYDPEADLIASLPSTSTRVYAKKSLPAILKPAKWLTGKRRTKKPGRPEREADYEITAVPSRREITARGLTNEEVNGLKYRRQRDLNNCASKKCRAKRGVKNVKMEQELVNETERNGILKKRAADMEEEITDLKQWMTPAQLMRVRVMMGGY